MRMRALSRWIIGSFQAMDADDGLEDEQFDVVFSSMFMHELPLKDIHQYLKEAFRC